MASNQTNEQVQRVLAILENATIWPLKSRNYYAVKPETEEYELCEDAVAMGVMFRGQRDRAGRVLFHVSNQGYGFLQSLSTKTQVREFKRNGFKRRAQTTQSSV